LYRSSFGGQLHGSVHKREQHGGFGHRLRDNDRAFRGRAALATTSSRPASSARTGKSASSCHASGCPGLGGPDLVATGSQPAAHRVCRPGPGDVANPSDGRVWRRRGWGRRQRRNAGRNIHADRDRYWHCGYWHHHESPHSDSYADSQLAKTNRGGPTAAPTGATG